MVLALSNVVEGAHMGHADFRVGGRIFASMNAGETTASVKLTPGEQARLMGDHQDAFTPASGAWGRGGWTVIELGAAEEEAVGDAVTSAWQQESSAGSRKSPSRRSPVDAYIAAAPAKARAILRKIRTIAREEAPEGEERISYRMPAFFVGGAVIYYAPFTRHIGIYPPVKGDASLEKALMKYKGPNGNLKFPLDESIPYPLIRRVIKARLKQLRAKKAARARR